MSEVGGTGRAVSTGTWVCQVDEPEGGVPRVGEADRVGCGRSGQPDEQRSPLWGGAPIRDQLPQESLETFGGGEWLGFELTGRNSLHEGQRCHRARVRPASSEVGSYHASSAPSSQ